MTTQLYDDETWTLPLIRQGTLDNGLGFALAVDRTGVTLFTGGKDYRLNKNRLTQAQANQLADELLHISPTTLAAFLKMGFMET